MAALKEIAREYAAEIRDGIGWVIVYRTGRSWHALTVWSDLGNNEWETDDINDALEALRLDPRAVALNGYYLGHFGDMTIDDIAAGIRWHYERGTNALADDDTLMQARADIEAARQQAAEAGLPFSERLVDGPEDELDPYTYDGSMTPEDYEAMQRARDAHAALVEVVADHYPNATEEAVERVAEAASSMKLSPEAVQRILDAFDNIIEAINRMIEWAVQAIRTLADFFGETLDNFILRRAPPKWRHYALHAKRARVRKKYRNRIAGLLRCAGFGRRWELVKFKCVGCGLYWNVSIYQQIPRGGYICPHCESRLRAGETLPNQRPGQNDRPQTTKGAKP